MMPEQDAGARAGGGRTLPHGSDLRLECWGTDLAGCCAAALAALAEHVADVPADLPRQAREVHLAAADPTELLIELLDEAITRLDTAGELACGLERATITPSGQAAHELQGRMQSVPLEGLVLRGASPKATTWHQARLTVGEDGWQGSIVLDL